MKSRLIHVPMQAVLVVAMLGAPLAAHADVYMWKDPATGKTLMTNIVPQWLREPKPGARTPKVEVIRDSKVLDPATAFAKPEPPPAPIRRRTEEGGEGGGSQVPGAQGTAGVAGQQVPLAGDGPPGQAPAGQPSPTGVTPPPQ